MKQIVRKLSMSIVMLWTFISASAYDLEVDGLYYNIISVPDNTCALTHGDNAYSGVITIPNSILVNGRYMDVIRIDKHTFIRGDSISELTIPNTITEIGDAAFNSNSYIGKLSILYGKKLLKVTTGFYSNIKELYIDRSMSRFHIVNKSVVEKITIGPHIGSFSDSLADDGSLNGFNLKCLHIEDSTDPIHIFYNTFYNSTIQDVYIGRNFRFQNYDETLHSPFEDTKIERLILGENVTVLQPGSFWGCSQLTSVEFSGIEEIGNWAFCGCKLLNTPVFPNSIKKIGDRSFYDCDSITEVVIDSDAELSIGRSAFEYCSSLRSIEIDGEIINIGGSAFYGCQNLSSVTLGEGVESIKGETFDGCSALNEIVMPNSLKSIEWKAFRNCNNLKKVTLGNNLEKIGKEAFYGVDLDSLKISSIVPPAIDGSTFTNKTYLNCAVVVPTESVAVYKSNAGWKNFWNIEGYDFTSLDDTILNETAIAVTVEDGTIRILQKDAQAIVRVFDIQGTVIAETTDYVIGNLSNGIYIVTVGEKSYKVKI